MPPLTGLDKDEIVALAVRAEKNQRRRQWTSALVAAALAAAIIAGLLVWGGWQLRNILSELEDEAARDAAIALSNADETQQILDRIDNQLVPRSDFLLLQRQLTEQRYQLRRLERLARAQTRALKQLSREVAALGRG